MAIFFSSGVGDPCQREILSLEICPMIAGLRSCRAPQATTPKRGQKKNQRASTAACVYAKTGIFRATSQL